MNSSSLAPVSGLLAGLPAVLAGALGGAPWWAVGVIVIAAYLAIPLTSLTLEHSRQRKGTLVDEKFAATLDQITDPEKRNPSHHQLPPSHSPRHHSPTTTRTTTRSTTTREPRQRQPVTSIRIDEEARGLPPPRLCSTDMYRFRTSALDAQRVSSAGPFGHSGSTVRT